MGLKSDLENQAAKVFRESWEENDGIAVPSDDSVTLGNDGIHIDATVLYADLADSTNLVDTHLQTFAAEVYKVYLSVAARIIRDMGGEITAYDGDRIMAVFVGNSKNSSAVESALKLKFAVDQIIMPKLKAVYTSSTYVLRHVVGIDTSDLFVAKTGIRGANDLVWVGTAANHAAKLSSVSEGFSTYITDRVYKRLNEKSKLSNGVDMWEERIWKWNSSTVYRSNYHWEFA